MNQLPVKSSIKSAVKLSSIFISIALLATPAVANGDDKDNIQQSRALAKNLFVNLKGALVAAMKEGGPAAAIAACNQQAQPITNALSSRRTGVSIKRTSLRLRNEKNAPDAWEIKVLEQFESRAAAGESLATMEHHEVVNSGEEKSFRYMKAIPAGKKCMVCHGEFITKNVLSSIRALYPLEQAIGFKPGDLRGAFSVTRKLD